jgi:tRNA (guanine37-N1)-methyltransferase
MKFSFVTLFPDLIAPYFEDSILKKAREKELIELNYINPRDYTEDKHLKVDDTPYSGGAGMVMTPQPLYDTLQALKDQDPNVHILFMTPSAKSFNQKDAVRLASKSHIALVSGRYEGIDERVIESYADEVFSIGDYILTGGELPSMVITDAISRNIKGVLGNHDSLETESFEDELLEAPSFTKPETFRKLSVTSEYLKGNHSKIQTLKKYLSLAKTRYYRPDLLKRKTD